MTGDEEGARATLRVFAIAAIALLGLAFSATPIAERLDAALLDAQWALLRKFDPRPAPDDIVVVGLDKSLIRAPKDPLAPWHEPFAKALARIASARPRAIALDVALPEHSFESARPGLDRMLLAALVAARENGPFVAVIDIDARTRAAKPIYPPYLAVLNDERLSLGLLSRDVDGVTRRFALMVPTEDGGFPTLAGRLCRALSKSCSDGLVHYALGPMFKVVALQQVVESKDPQFLERLFRDRIVMIGETQRDTDRVEVPVNLAGWEPGGRTSPGVVVHAQALRTALMGAAPVEAARPFTLVLVTLAALLCLMREARLAAATAILVAAGLGVGATLLLRGGVFLPISAALFSLALAWAARAALQAWQRRRTHTRRRAAFADRVSSAVMKDILRGKLAPGERAQRLELAFVAAGLREPLSNTPDLSPDETLAALGRFHEVVANAVHRHDGMLESVGACGVVAVFGVPKPVKSPCRPAWSAVQDMLRGLIGMNAELAKKGKPPMAIVVGAAFGEAVAGKIAARGPLIYSATGAAAEESIRLRDEARRSGQSVLVSEAFRAGVGAELSDFPHPRCD